MARCPLAVDQRQRLTTARLDADRRRLLALKEIADGSDASAKERAGLDPALIYFKDGPRWSALRAAVLRELAAKAEPDERTQSRRRRRRSDPRRDGQDEKGRG